MPSGGKLLKTQTFIGSSTEGLVVANALKAHLLDTTDCQVWTEGVFLPGRTFIETLETMLDQMDYAILVATPDDMLRQRNVESFSMRDNVLLELGLFMAKLGRTRTYLVTPRDQAIHIPSDLLGLTTVSYESASTPVEAVQALKEPCENIKKAMREAEKELSLAMRRTVVKRLLTLTNQIQGFVVTLQSESVRSLLDRSEFERIRSESADRLAGMAKDYEDDAARLGIADMANRVTNIVQEAVKDLPFPEETIVTQSAVVGSLLSHLTGRRSVDEEIRERIGRLADRYDKWWDRHGPRISSALNEFQGALISAM